MKRGNKRKFGRTLDQRQAFFKALATALIINTHITTTHARAKALTQYVDRLITIAKKQDISARRNLSTVLGAKAVKILINEITPQFRERQGGYTRITRLGQRQSDGSLMSRVEFTA